MTEERFDPIALEVLWNRLISICNEQAAALMRTSFTTIVRESQDLAAGVFDARGNMIAQSVTGTPGHINSMATSIHHFLAALPVHTLEPGDVLITNDPWHTSGQLHDLTIVTPVFRAGRVVGFFGSTCHAADIGGRGLSAEGREVYEEGLYIPVLKLYRHGEPNDDLFAIIRSNVRSPDMVLGDINAQVSGNHVAGLRLVELLQQLEQESLEPIADAIIERSERAMRTAIARIRPGIYTNETWSDGIAGAEPIHLVCTVRVSGSTLHVDYGGSSPQSPLGINVVLNYTTAYTTFGIKAAISPDVPNNEGSFRPVTVTAPVGCILNAQHPAPVAARHIIGHLLPNTLFGALAQAVPDRVMAEGAAATWITQMRGRDVLDRPFNFTLFSAGGAGARPTRDGWGNTGFPSGVAGVPVEVLESMTPMVVGTREVRRDSGGAGRCRGGLGQSLTLRARSGRPWTVSGLFDRLRIPPRGYCGGADGARGECRLSDGSEPDMKVQQAFAPDAELRLDLPGGGGFWPATEREPAAVLADVVDGRVSLEAARRDYGVAIVCRTPPGDMISLPSEYEIDEAETARLRAGSA